MVKYTNKMGLPDYVEAWLKDDGYDYVPGVYSATRLLKPTRMILLEERHGDEMTIDIADRIAMRYGTAIHAAFEEVKLDPAVFTQEKRVFTQINGVTISGKYDMVRRYPDGTLMLIDLKSTSVWKYVFEEFDEFLKQLSIYRLLLEANGEKVRGAAEIMMIFTDWSRQKAKDETDGRYPKSRIVIQPLPLWDTDTTRKFIEKRLKEIDEAKGLEDDKLPACTDEELWRDVKKDKFAVYAKPGDKKARFIFDSLDAAEAYVKQNGGVIQPRLDRVRRCPEYCPAWPFCNQHRALKEAGLVENGGE